ncbi:energy transducer TonB [Geomonas sp. RF6]|uniref:energy transducer TonB family protein n=1 Tax=Geomonas sp. RF6 TaxID=2897342 RepID=UPI001E4D19C7|nr:energy transducer TonB [Geomonas sp. RF6]UFS70381.1 energy transducer TonB [Geomonas sp. RF6]
MSDKYVEKTFLYLLALSILLHVAGYFVFSRMETAKPEVKDEPMMVDLSTIPDIPPAPLQAQKEPPLPESPPVPKAPAPEKSPVPTPKLAERIDNPPPLPASRAPQREAKIAPRVTTPEADRGTAGKQQGGKPPAVSEDGIRPPDADARRGTGGNDIFRVRKGEGKGDEIGLSKLFPSQKRLASLEEGYRKKYEGAEQGDTRMMDTDDPTIAVYSHRLLVAANDSLKVLARRTASHGAGVGVLQVTIRRDGSIESVKMVETTRSAALDNLALTAVRETGYVGPLPKKWQHEKLNLLWIFVSSQSPQGY